jgi:uncharacterized protein DUF4199
MMQKILGYGVVAGIIVGAPMIVTFVLFSDHLPLAWGMVVGYTSMLVALSTIFVAIKRRRDADLGGVIGFWQAFGIGLGISVVASVFYVATWEALQAFTHMDFAGGYSKALIEQQKAAGASAEALAKLNAEMEQFRTDYANPLFRLPMTFIEIFPIGVLVSAVAAALLRNRRFLALKRA